MNFKFFTLNSLLEINTDDLSLSNFSSDSAVNLWWSDCSIGCRVNQKRAQSIEGASKAPHTCSE